MNNNEINYEGIEQMPIKQFSENAYLNYSMYVIMDRAFPFIGDGLKPVQRRIIYTMSLQGLKHTAKYQKAVSTVGEVLGKFHPHGDTACYGAMVTMAQPFNFRYPLVDGQGNWGSLEDNAAAMRYTESRMTPFTDILLSEIPKGAVEFQPNFDGRLDEPVFLPARLPHILLNASEGIGVAIATKIPSHNLTEVAKACILLLDNPNATLDDILEVMPAPDFPSDAEIITSRAEFKKIYEKGRGSFRMRALYQIENGDIVITALPYRVSTDVVIKQIVAEIEKEKLPISNVRNDQSMKNNLRIVLELRRSQKITPDRIMEHLFAKTALESSFPINMNMLGIDGKPAVKGLLTILTEWLEFRRQTVTRRINCRLAKISDRLHALEGLLIAYLNIDEVIEIIRNEDDPKSVMMQRFGLSEEQVEAILNLRLRQLAKLEETELKAELHQLQKEQKELEELLGSPRKLNNLIKKEIQADMATYGDARRSPLVEREEAKAIEQSEALTAEDVTVILSEKGWVRCAKGHDIDPLTLAYQTGDRYLAHARGKSNQPVVFMDNFGRAYTLDCNNIASAKSKSGDPLSSKVTLNAGAQVIQVLMANDEDKILMASDAGYGFICQFGDLVSRNKAGKVVLSLSENAQALPPQHIPQSADNALLVAISSVGRMLVFPVSELPTLAKGKGNKIINIATAAAKARSELLTKLFTMTESNTLKFISGKRSVTLKPSDIQNYRGERARKGSQLVRGLNPNSEIVILD